MLPTAECCRGLMTAGQLHLIVAWNPDFLQWWSLRCSAACLQSGIPCTSWRCCRMMWRDQRCLRRCREGPREMPGYSNLTGHRLKIQPECASLHSHNLISVGWTELRLFIILLCANVHVIFLTIVHNNSRPVSHEYRWYDLIVCNIVQMLSHFTCFIGLNSNLFY